MIKLTPARTLELLREAVEEKGADFVYNSNRNDLGACVYVHGTNLVPTDMDEESGMYTYKEVPVSDLTPGCMVGNALIRAGVAPQIFLDLDINKDTSAGEAIRELESVGLLAFESSEDRDTVKMLFGAAQECQDDGQRWGLALRAARNALL